MAEIEIEVSKKGEVKVEVIGHSGPGCVQLTEALEAALGTVKSRETKPEFHEVVEEVDAIHLAHE